LFGGIPGETNSRAESIQGVVEEMLLAGHDSGRNLALKTTAGTGERHAANSLITQTVGRVEEILVTEPQVYRKVRGKLPVILYKGRQGSVTNQTVELVQSRSGGG